ncbi:MAG: hypothetical protein F6K40_22765 [Okeania sp. SIO3I5]|uniref:hypothetical protein n=1 Tax=Okeania sp. SIO3I5 TaxID=2607805 RepID=UPI0013B83172|nr:hypothetical protein [Okeania sp. SIO3I5]NEQ38939.1 hypothetical protein [Okeania sp. SIO3I5]
MLTKIELENFQCFREQTHDDKFLEQHKQTIQQNFVKLRENYEYVGSIKRVRHARDTVIKRFDLPQ